MIRPCAQCGRECTGPALIDVATFGEVEVFIYVKGKKIGARTEVFPAGLVFSCPACVPFLLKGITTSFHVAPEHRPKA